MIRISNEWRKAVLEGPGLVGVRNFSVRVPDGSRDGFSSIGAHGPVTARMERRARFGAASWDAGT